MMVEIAKHKFVEDPKVSGAALCTSCKLPRGHEIHRQNGRLIHGTATPKKLG